MTDMTRYLYLIILLAVIGCGDDGTYEPDGNHSPIYLAVAVDNGNTTRAPYELTEPTTEKPLNVDVWASTDKYVFPNSVEDGSDAYGGVVKLHTTARFLSSAPQLLNSAIYNKDAQQKVYFVSMYPQGWEALYHNTQADYTFNGAQDLMFAPQISGVYATDYEKTPLLHFHHLLTWLSFELKADTEEAATAWGKIKKIEIKSCNAVSVDLSAASYDEETVDGTTVFKYKWDGDGIKFTDEVQLPLYHVNPPSVYLAADTTFEDKYYAQGGYELDYLAAHEVAYVMCAPVVGSYTNADDELTNEYLLNVVTDKRTVEIGLDLKKAAGEDVDSYYVGSTMGRKFNFLLNFRLGNTITVTAKMNDWEPGGIINKDIKE